MIKLDGKYCDDCIVYSDSVEQSAMDLIQGMLDSRLSKGKRIRIMPDVHAGTNIVIGFTMQLGESVNPEHIGVDIGCGMRMHRIPKLNVSLEKLDEAIRGNVPMGFDVHDKAMLTTCYYDYKHCNEQLQLFVKKYNETFGRSYVLADDYFNDAWLKRKLSDVGCSIDKFNGSIGTLGGGNHFIEFGKDDDDQFYFTIHSGSRNFGLRVEKHWADKMRKDRLVYDKDELRNLVATITSSAETEEDRRDIPNKIAKLYDGAKRPGDCLEGTDAIGYFTDMIFAQEYARMNRSFIAKLINDILGIQISDKLETYESVHNYIDFSDMMIRKGAIRANVDDVIIIPFNMRDGILLCRGKSNADWNFSAPHGSGRLMSRTAAKKSILMEDFRASMEGIVSSSVCESTLDESPFAYKDAREIEDAIAPTAEVICRIKPILNIKSNK